MRTVLAEEAHIVNVIPPIDITGGVNGDLFSMAKWHHASIIIAIGVSAAAFTSIKLSACSAADATGDEAIDFNVYKQETAAGDVLGAKVAATAADGVTPTADDNVFYVIELDSADLPEGKPWVRVELANGANSVIASAVAVLTGGRYSGPESPTVLA